MTESVSIIIPHFNRTTLLLETIESVLKQTYSTWEMIIVDDQSDSDEWIKLQQFASDQVKIIQREHGEKGPSACRNLGAKHANGEFLIFLDSDDLLSSFCLQQRIDAMNDNPELDVCIFLMKEFEETPDDNNRVFNRDVDEAKWISAFIKNENPWNVTCPIWKRDAFLRTGGFDESLLYMEDPDLHLRALQSGLRFKTMYHLPADCFYRVHHFDETKSSFYYNSILYRIKFYQKLTSGLYPDAFVQQYKQDIRKGVSVLVRTFLYSRRNQFQDLYNELIIWMKSSGLYLSLEIFKYQLLLNVGNTNNSILKRLKVKGLCYKLLPA